MNNINAVIDGGGVQLQKEWTGISSVLTFKNTNHMKHHNQPISIEPSSSGGNTRNSIDHVEELALVGQHSFHRELRTKLDNKDWAGIIAMLRPSLLQEGHCVDGLENCFHRAIVDLLFRPDSDRTEAENKEAEELIVILIKLGGKKFILHDFHWNYSRYHVNLLHAAFTSRASPYVISKILEVGGKEVVMKKTRNGDNLLHIAIERYSTTLDVINQLIKVGGKDILSDKNKYGQNPLHLAFEKRSSSGHLSLLIKKGIELRVGGEYGFGGLLSTDCKDEVRDRIYHNWDNIVLPALEQGMAQFHNQSLPILQAAIIHEMPLKIIQSLLEVFAHAINTKDSSGNYAIDVAVERKLSWDGGLKDIVDAFALAQQNMILLLCAKHGVQWENGTRQVLERTNLDVLERKEDASGLYPFMVAALRGKKNGYDFDSVFHLIQQSPLLLHMYCCDHCNEENRLRKRKRN